MIFFNDLDEIIQGHNYIDICTIHYSVAKDKGVDTMTDSFPIF